VNPAAEREEEERTLSALAAPLRAPAMPGAREQPGELGKTLRSRALVVAGAVVLEGMLVVINHTVGRQVMLPVLWLLPALLVLLHCGRWPAIAVAALAVGIQIEEAFFFARQSAFPIPYLELGMQAFAFAAVAYLMVMLQVRGERLVAAEKGRTAALLVANELRSLKVTDEILRTSVARLAAVNQELEAARNYQRCLFESTLTSLVTVSLDGKITDLNTAAQKTTGRPREELLGTDLSDYFSAPDLVRAGHEQALREGQIADYPLEILHRDGHTTPVLCSASVYRDDAGAVIGILAAARDITAQRQLQKSLERMSQVFMQATDSIVITTLDGTILNANPETEVAYGWTVEELLGQSLMMLRPAEFESQAQQGLAGAAQGKSFRNVDATRWNKTGQLIPVLVTVFPLLDGAGRPTATVTIAKDISNLKRAEQQLRNYATQLDASNHELEAFSYSVAHDLRAPLRALDGFSQALLEDYHDKLDEQGQDFLGRIRGASQRMGELIDDLLELSRVTRSPLNYAEVNLSALAADIARDLRNAGVSRVVDLVISPGLMVNADAGLMRVVLTNLLANAWKFTGSQPQARIEFGVEEQEGEAAYFVRDNGAGFDMAHASQLFAPFQRLHGQGEFAGTGIGLSITERIIERHGGRIWAEGAVGRGATFYFTLSGHE
jgi:PAS domain S-box-containing protein